EINRDHVMLRYQGKIERLSLAEEGHSTVAVTNKKAVSDEAKQAVAEPAASAPVEIPTAVRQALTKDPQKIFNYIQLTPVRKEGIFPLPQGQIAVTLRDAQACFNLNALAQPTTASRPLAVQQLIALISRLDVPAYRYVMNTRKVHTDDTPVKVLAPGQKKAKTGRIWTYVRDDRNVGSSSPPAVWFAYSPNRQGKHPEQHLRPFRGILQADAFTGYDRLFSAEREGGALTEVACWAHARRKIHDVYISSKSATAEEALKRISELYA
ncbi:TPA: transposase, partial [Escherichia coli]|nr:transposase [Escherichia coli]